MNGALMKRTNNTIRDYVCLLSKLQFPSHLFLFRNYYLRLVIFEGILASSSRVFFVVPCSILRLTLYMFFSFSLFRPRRRGCSSSLVALSLKTILHMQQFNWLKNRRFDGQSLTEKTSTGTHREAHLSIKLK